MVGDMTLTPQRLNISRISGRRGDADISASGSINWTSGPAQLVLFPGESFVGYQLQAQKQRPKSFVVSLGYGECWPGYIPTTQGFRDKFRDVWLWVGPGSDRELQRALDRVLPRR